MIEVAKDIATSERALSREIKGRGSAEGLLGAHALKLFANDCRIRAFGETYSFCF
jgi:hypothetical protein